MLEGRPSSGVRVEVERSLVDEIGDGVVVYVGHAHLAMASVPLRLRASAVRVEVHLETVEAGCPAALKSVVAALVRAATKKDLTAGTDPPKRVVRWRPLDDRTEST